jgi:hypothetical protein
LEQRICALNGKVDALNVGFGMRVWCGGRLHLVPILAGGVWTHFGQENGPAFRQARLRGN